MPWDEPTRMEQRERFIGDLDSCLFTMTELCEHYGVSRKTGYKWAERYAGGGMEGLSAPFAGPEELRSPNPGGGSRPAGAGAPVASDLGSPQVVGLAAQAGAGF